MNLNKKLLHSKVAGRFFFLFVACALVPISILAFLSFGKVTQRLNDQNQKQLHQASKGLGMTFFERLLFLESEMMMIASHLNPDQNLQSSFLPKELHEKLKNHFNFLRMITPKGKEIPIVNSLSPSLSLELSRKEKQHIAKGNTLIFTQFDTGRKPHILMLRGIDPSPKGTILLAEIHPSYLWGQTSQNNLPLLTEFMILDPSNNILFSSTPNLTSIPKIFGKKISIAQSGYFQWTSSEKEYLVSFWALFLKSYFLAPEWTIVLSQPQDFLLAPVSDFHNSFLLIVFASIVFISLLSVWQIQKLLIPLDRLKEGALRIIQKDLKTQIVINSQDEFGELAETFNKMSSQLDRQFQIMSATGDIQRAILSVLNTQEIVQIFLKRIPQIYPCDFLSVVLLDSKNPNIMRAYVGENLTIHEIKNVEPHSEELKTLMDHSKEYSIFEEKNCPSFIQKIQAPGIKKTLVIPIFFSHRPIGMILMGHSHSTSNSPDDLAPLRQLGNQIGIAIANAQMVEQIHYLAYFDGLTHLPNQALFLERLGQSIHMAKRSNKQIAVLFLDLDHFKRINDTFGPEAGDQILIDVSERLSHSIREIDTLSRFTPEGIGVARLGGDEFVIILTETDSVPGAIKVAKRIHQAFSEPFTLKDKGIYISSSFGIALYPKDGQTPDTLLKNAETAMYHSKNTGRNNYQFYTSSMKVSGFENFSLEYHLRHALDNNELILHYQPKMDARTLQWIGAEALIRWNHPSLGLLPPLKFIPLAEENGMIIPIGAWVLRSACLQNKVWNANGLHPFHISVNLSSRQFKQKNLVKKISNIIEETGIDPKNLDLELTETIIMEDTKKTISTLEDLKSLGLQLTVDDFGTGYSSLNYLKRFPIDRLKIDQSFIRDILQDSNTASLVKAIISMGHALNLQVVAEGVETEAQLEFLQEQGCNEIQGYFTGRPMPPEALSQLLNDRKKTPAQTKSI